MGRNAVRIICLVFSIFLICGIFSGCYDRREIDELAYVIAIGFDKGITNVLKITLQIAVPKALGGGGGSGGEGGQSTTITTVETSSIYAGLNMINNYVSKQINLSHAKAIVFSEELAREGIQKYMHSLIRGKEFRGNMNIVVARGSAEDYICSIKPILEINPAKYYEMNYSSYKYTGFTSNTQLLDFYIQEESTTEQAVATLAGVGKYKSSQDFTLEVSTYKGKGEPYPYGGDFKAGDIPKTGEVKGEIMGLAVFDGDKMVGELDGKETTFYLMLNGKYNYSYVSIPDPMYKNDVVMLNMSQSRRPVRKVEIVDGKPKIKIKILLEADILSIQSGKNYDNVENLPLLEITTEDFIKKGMLDFLNKTSKDFKSDICGFGRDVKGRFLTWKEWENFKWLSRYKDSEFDLFVDLKIRRSGQIIRSIPMQTSGGEEADQ